jgi:putative addiction module component (TIGR02574 family)
MTTEIKRTYKEALTLPPKEKAGLVERLLASLDEPDEHIDNVWRKEVEERIKAYKSGRLRAVSFETVLAKYKK